MRKLIALVLVAALLVGIAAPAAHAGSSTDIALGLASFAVFNQIVGPLLHPRPAYAGYRHKEVVVERPVYREVVYTQPSQVVVVQPAPAYPTVVQYPHGRYELRGDGYRTPYQWVWVPNPPPPPPAAPPPPPIQ
jgi:hypothetical protein